jgi:hypothetical protein
MHRASVVRTGARCRTALALVAALASLIALPGGAWAQPTPAPPVVVDGPSADITTLSGLSVARDGTGGLVYLKSVLGVPHVFVLRLLGGTFQAPEQLDAALPGASSQPVIAAGYGGLLLTAFINGGRLYVVDRLNAFSSYGPPLDLFDGAANPSLQATPFGKAYLAFTAAGAGGGDVRTAFYYRGRWALESAPLDAVAADDAGSGTGRPRVAAAGDGVAIVVWGEAGHIFSRRVWGTSPSIVDEQADVPSLSGWGEISADQPSVAAGGDSSYAPVVFDEHLSNGSQQQSRVLMRRLRGSEYENVAQPDGLTTPAMGGADQPQVVMGEYGRGFATSARDDSNALFAEALGNNGIAGGLGRVDSLQNTTPPDGVPAMAGLFSALIAWQQNPGSAGIPEIRIRYATDGLTLGPELLVSSPTLGATDAASGLSAAGDGAGEAAAAWVQGTGSTTRIVVAQLYQSPGSFAATAAFQYVRSAEPVLTWSRAHAHWGPLRYSMTIDGVPLAQTTATSLRVPSRLRDGVHTWQVTAVNPAGRASRTRVARIWVDTVAPAVHLKLTGSRRSGSLLHVYVTYTDAPPPELPANASGIADVVVKWGDRSSNRIRHGKFHAYKRAGRYKLSVIVVDRAGNTTTLLRTVKIAP